MKKCLENIIESYKKMKLLNYCFIINLILTGIILSKEIKSVGLKRDLNNYEELYRKGKSLEMSGLNNEAEQIYLEIFRNSPKNTKYYTALKKLLILKKDCDALIDNTELFCYEMDNNKNALLNMLESKIICDLDWVDTFYKLKNNNINDTAFLKRLIFLLINNKHYNIAISSINEIRRINNNNALFAMDLAYHYVELSSYDKAVTEYLNYLNKSPKHFKMISERIMMLPNTKKAQDLIIPVLENSETEYSKVILSDIYFKMNNPSKSIKILKEFSLYENLLSLGINLETNNDYKNAQEIYLYLISETNNKITQKALHQLASCLEAQSIKKKNTNISSNFTNNSFLSSPFIKISQKNSNYLNEAITLYDSLGFKNNNLNSLFRLADIKFKILGDLDDAYSLYNKIYNSDINKDLRIRIVNRLCDVLIAKGDLNRSLNFINSELESSIWNINERNNLEIKKNQILFYQSEIDLVFKNLTKIANNYSIKKTNYNDILGVMNTILVLKKNKQLAKKYCMAQLKINQNKRTESIEILNDIIIDSNDEIFNNMVNFQAATLLVDQNKINDAIIKLNQISGEYLYKELSVIFLGEIYQYILKDNTAAKIKYFSLLQDFPNSIYYEKIRLRLLEMTNETL
tara:strand:- start:5873 stop:7768 length:1896 start_codon:yes stop_codon:yes gene_type:complete